MESSSPQLSPSEGHVGPGLIESVWRYRWLVAAVTVVAGLAGYGVSTLQSPTYEAQARLLLIDPAAAGLFEETGRADEERSLGNQAEMANSPDVHARAADLLGAEHTEQEVGGRAEVRPSEAVDVLTVVGEGDSPGQAAALANAVAEAYQQLRAEAVQERAEQSIEQLDESVAQLRQRIETAEEALTADENDLSAEAERDAAIEQVATFESRADQIAVDAALFGSGVEQFTEARPPNSPSEPLPRRNAAVGVVLGMLAGSGLAWWRAERVQSAADRHDPAPVLQAPLLAQVPEYKHVGVTGLDPARSAPDSVAAESYQFLVSSLEYALERVGGRSVVVTSAEPAAGKTLTAFNLAIAAARDGRRVVLCDCDERTRGLTALTGTAQAPGIADLGDDAVPIEGATAMIDVPFSQGLPFVPAGSPPSDPAGFFRTSRFRTAMRRVKQHGDLVILDSPPILAVSDTSAIAGQVDGILMVVAQGTPLRTLQEVRERLDFVGTPVLGYVFNRSDSRGAAQYLYGPSSGHGYGDEGWPKPARAHARASANGDNPRETAKAGGSRWKK